MGLYAKPMKGQELLSFLFEGDRKKLCCFTMYFQTSFSIPTNYNSLGYRQLSQCLHASMSCCPDDLALLLPCLGLWSLGSKNVSIRKWIFTFTTWRTKEVPSWRWPWHTILCQAEMCVLKSWKIVCFVQSVQHCMSEAPTGPKCCIKLWGYEVVCTQRLIWLLFTNTPV